MATSCLLATLCMLFPAWHLAFVVLLGLDIFSHWFQMYSTLACGVSSHKVGGPWGGGLKCAVKQGLGSGEKASHGGAPCSECTPVELIFGTHIYCGALMHAGFSLQPHHPLQSLYFQDTNSRSRVVRFYYQQRLFMGFCCVCCEVLYLCLYLLAWPQYRAWGVLPLPQTWLQLGGSAGGRAPSGDGPALCGVLGALQHAHIAHTQTACTRLPSSRVHQVP